MVNQSMNKENLLTRLIFPWSVHLFTFSQAIFSLYGLKFLVSGQYNFFFICLLITILIDTVDGTLAKIFKVKIYLPHIDAGGADLVIDFVNFSFLPAYYFFIQPHDIGYNAINGILVMLASSYWYSKKETKTKDSFFLGFPCLWSNIAIVNYLLDLSGITTFILILVCTILTFIPTKYPHGFNGNYLYKSSFGKKFYPYIAVIATAACVIQLLFFDHNSFFSYVYYAYTINYYFMGFWRTYNPLPYP